MKACTASAFHSALRGVFTLALSLSSVAAFAAAANVTISRQGADARLTDIITVPWSSVAAALPGAQPDKLVVKDSAGKVLTYQFTNFHPDDRTGRYDGVLFAHTFAAGEKSATFRIESSTTPFAPFTSLVSARHVPERYDDFAWENNRVAHRIYGVGLTTEAAGRSRMVSSGVDVWCKRVGYNVVDRWYLRGHDAYHKDNGEGLDFYSVGTGRGAGGTGVWVNGKLSVSGNWMRARVIANGPIRAIFEVDYDEWKPSPSLWVRETRRYTVDIDRNLDRVESTFTITGAESATVAVGLGKHANATAAVTSDLNASWLSLWEKYPKADEGELGTAVAIPGGLKVAQAEDELNHLLLVPVRSGTTLTYFAGAGWSRSGHFADAAAWEAHVKATLAAEADPVQVRVTAEP